MRTLRTKLWAHNSLWFYARLAASDPIYSIWIYVLSLISYFPCLDEISVHIQFFISTCCCLKQPSFHPKFKASSSFNFHLKWSPPLQVSKRCVIPCHPLPVTGGHTGEQEKWNPCPPSLVAQGAEPACHCRRHRFDPLSGKILRALRQLSPCRSATDTVLRAQELKHWSPWALQPLLHSKRNTDFRKEE